MDDVQGQAGEITIKGIAAAPGIAIGPATLYTKQIFRAQMKPIDRAEADSEIERLRSAVARSEKELRKIITFAEQKLNSDDAKILEAQIMILGDSILMKAIETRIRSELQNAEFVVFDEISKYKRLMLSAPDEYMHERAHDVDDVMNRIIRNIQDQKLVSRLEGEFIIASESLTPADTVIFSRNTILGYATDTGGVTSHAAILSRSLKIPAVVGLRTVTRNIHHGDQVALDGYSGVVVIHPTEETVQALRRKAQRFREFEERLVEIVGLSAETLDHKHIELSANIEFEEEIPFAREQGSVGIGLLRTESQLMSRTGFPSEDELYETYRKIVDGMYPHSVIVRVFDAGGDKIAPGSFHESNPFLGWRGIRVLLDRPDLFLTQLRAILRASDRKTVRIMFPMVSTLEEIRRAKEMVELAKAELTTRGQTFDHSVKLGIMIETPAAAIIADLMAAEVDFLSIGTNDLVQYVMAVDRDNMAVAPLYQQFNPAVLRTIKMVIDAGHKKNRWVGMCGEMAGDPLATVPLVGMGLDEFSVIPTVLPEIKKIIRSIKFKDAKRVAEKVLAMTSEVEAHAYLSTLIRNQIPEIPLEP
jgi:phosphoenolpyruvate-protein phosphotransferase (PTS system enzyme I)